MEDPVLLPTSNTIVDRSTIETHLLSDVVDPFNRQPLTMQMVVEGFFFFSFFLSFVFFPFFNKQTKKKKKYNSN